MNATALYYTPIMSMGSSVVLHAWGSEPEHDTALSTYTVELSQPVGSDTTTSFVIRERDADGEPTGAAIELIKPDLADVRGPSSNLIADIDLATDGRTLTIQTTGTPTPADDGAVRTVEAVITTADGRTITVPQIRWTVFIPILSDLLPRLSGGLTAPELTEPTSAALAWAPTL